jgi:FtsH-binding integral membrane protein
MSSKNNPPKKKVVVAAQPAAPRTRTAPAATPSRELTFGKDTYIWMGIGLLLIAVGMALMSGGAMPDANTWDNNLIYGFRRVTLAPIVILLGLAVEVYAIFKK